MIAYMPRNATQRAIHRIRIVQGLMNKLEQSVRDDQYCIDTLNQSMAIQKALKSFDKLLLEKHLNSCIKDHMKNGKQGEKLRGELLALYNLSQ
jgi:DNA-binding FrmR family transcriptional regulator